jgi:hypothetical protein
MLAGIFAARLFGATVILSVSLPADDSFMPCQNDPSVVVCSVPVLAVTPTLAPVDGLTPRDFAVITTRSTREVWVSGNLLLYGGRLVARRPRSLWSNRRALSKR